ncbi:hypothetical protein Leryth_017844 [Lithospermum erythrorhizon]|nr:hypothetical protein Leryth_017844 [Lithospermum erythrorhizon]
MEQWYRDVSTTVVMHMGRASDVFSLLFAAGVWCITYALVAVGSSTDFHFYSKLKSNFHTKT